MNLSKPSFSSATDAPGLLYAGFNQDFGCFATGLDNGFRIYNSDPLKEKMRRDFEDGGISIVEMLFRCNYLALIGGGRNPKYPPTKVIVWDDMKKKEIAILEFRSEVKNIKLRRDKFVVILSNKVFVYAFSVNPQKLHTFETIDNDKGLVALSSSSEHAILAFPGRQKGHIQIVDLNTFHASTAVTSNNNNTLPTHSSSTTSSFSNHRHSFSSSNYNDYQSPTMDRRSSVSNTGKIKKSPESSGSATVMTPNVSIIPAHSGRLCCISVNTDGSKCASASEKGTLIRVFNTKSGKLLNELRRGVDHAEIYSIAFSQDSRRLCVSSDKGTVHIFNLDASLGIGIPSNGEMMINNQMMLQSPSGNRQSSFSFMKDLLPKYFSSEWSFAHFKVTTDCQCICGFGQDANTIIVLCADGSYYKVKIDPNKGGECVPDGYEKFLNLDE